MPSAVIIDDQRINSEMLQEMIQQFCPTVKVLGSSTTIEEGYVLINRHHPDIVFLDVELTGDDTGFDLLNMFKPVFFKTIFITAHSHYAVNAFRENATDYLLKPVDIRQLQIAVSRVEDALASKVGSVVPELLSPEYRISLPTQEGYMFVQPVEILYCEGSGSYTHFYFLSGKKVTISTHLKECEAMLPRTVFCRIHNSYIVNVNYVARYIRGRVGTVVLNNNIELEVSASRKEAFLQMIKNG